ncbi:MAG: hypothetical protein VX694_06085, partial [Planctomycetota bacterium]|nr:hypothetical protein [Planctomycetota bacterium]
QLNVKPRTEYLARIRNTPAQLMTRKQIEDLETLKSHGSHGHDEHGHDEHGHSDHDHDDHEGQPHSEAHTDHGSEEKQPESPKSEAEATASE